MILVNYLLPFCVAQGPIVGGRSVQETSFVRQMAKDGTLIHFVVSGPETHRMADAMIENIRGHRDWKGNSRKIEVVSPVQMAALIRSKPKAATDTIVMLLIQSESELVPDELATAMSFEPKSDSVSRTTAQIEREVSQGLSFHVTITAPDADREQRLIDEFDRFQAPGPRALKMSASHRSQHIVVHSQPGVDIAWGDLQKRATDPNRRIVNTNADWNTVQKCSLAENPVGQGTDADSLNVYLVDRTADPGGMPEPLAAVEKVIPGGQLLVRRGIANGQTWLLLSAPNKDLLGGLAGRFSGLDRVPDDGFTMDLPDLRLFNGAAVYLKPGLLPAETGPVIQERIVTGIKEMKLEAVGGSSEDADLDALTGTQLSRKIRIESKVGFALLVSVDDAKGGTEEAGNMERASDIPEQWSAVEPWYGVRPVKPDRHANENDVQRSKAIADWEQQCAQYDAASDAWQNKVQIKFVFHEVQRTHAEVQIKVSLVDLAARKVVWERIQKGTYEENKPVQDRTLFATGGPNKPDSPELPAPTEDCPARFFVQSVGNATGLILTALDRETWRYGNPFGQTAPTEPALAEEIKLSLATVSKVQATVKLPQGADAKVGDLMVATVQGKPCRMRITATTGGVAVCKPVTDQDKARLALLKAGTPVKWVSLGED